MRFYLNMTGNVGDNVSTIIFNKNNSNNTNHTISKTNIK